MGAELKQLMSASKQHIVTVRSQHTDQKQLDSLQRQLADMNKLKVSLTGDRLTPPLSVTATALCSSVHAQCHVEHSLKNSTEYIVLSHSTVMLQCINDKQHKIRPSVTLYSFDRYQLKTVHF